MVISLRFFHQRKNERSKTYGYRDEPASIESGRIAFWLRFIKHRSLGMENLSLISFRLKELVSSVVAYQENLTQKELEDSLNSGMLRLPREVQIYLDSKNQVTGVPPKKASIIEKFLIWIKMRTSVDQDTSFADLREVVEYLEEQLEIKHDDGN
jgi:hypothetical protein